MNSAFFAVQDGIYAALAADPALQALIGNPARIYDHVPSTASFPFVTLGEMRAESFDSWNHDGMNHRVMLHAWSRERGRKEIKQIMEAIQSRLHDRAFSIAGQRLIRCRLLTAEALLDDDGLSYHGIAQYQVITEETP
jgi:hypothetical protein